ncbi:MAG: rRNA maturation RNase YbeY [Porticoccaceae bacterium]|nr:rRNA maturation RNase YbeY [Pseudomonadales bacterium]MCP5172713.1 rRNA maturation RNase YbeY [Pseudomonadales bacterium]MCP5302187.1 rRNA maturation RNase YbeY [Pseudomonadales bacterium]
MKLDLSLDNATSSCLLPDEEDVHRWASAALEGHCPAAALSIRIVDEQESADLNLHYRHKPGPTNVLSFPAEIPGEILLQLEFPPLGDLAICAPVMEREAAQQDKDIVAHWAHIVVHGCLHLVGYDHLNDTDADKMERQEITLLKGFGFSNPYEQHNSPSNKHLLPQGADEAT